MKEPEHLERYTDAVRPFDVETQYALKAFATRTLLDTNDEAELARLEAGLPTPSADVVYLEPELSALPTVQKPKVEPTRLSTGEVALEIVQVGSGWQTSCTGCGESSPAVQFRWQVLDQTVPCRCS